VILHEMAVERHADEVGLTLTCECGWSWPLGENPRVAIIVIAAASHTGGL
jgi:hypothetical protein